MTGAPGGAPQTAVVRNVAGAAIGNALEWYDILVYAYFAGVIGQRFFPAENPLTSTLLVFGTFGLSFVIRPVGGIVIGRYADRRGRRAALVLASLLMCGGTALITFLPTYETIGVAAPVLLLVARLIQGFSAGGEFGSATTYLAEQGARRPGLVASVQFASQGLGMFLAAAVGTLLTAWLEPAEIASWGWRIPFLLGTLIGPVAFLIRNHATETPDFLEAERAGALARSIRLKPMIRPVLVGAGLVAAASVGAYFLVYLPTYATAVLHLPARAGFQSSLAASLVLVLVTPIAGWLADRIGFRAVAFPAAAGLALLPPALLSAVVAAPGVTSLIALQAATAFLLAGYFGALPVLMVRLFPVHMRSLGLSISYNLAVVTLGGFAPMIFAMLAASVGASGPAFYLSAAAGISSLTLLAARSLLAPSRPAR